MHLIPYSPPAGGTRSQHSIRLTSLIIELYHNPNRLNNFNIALDHVKPAMTYGYVGGDTAEFCPLK